MATDEYRKPKIGDKVILRAGYRGRKREATVTALATDKFGEITDVKVTYTGFFRKVTEWVWTFDICWTAEG